MGSRCPLCGTDKEPVCTMEVDLFKILIDQVEMDLRIAVPVEHCMECNFQWTDQRAEKIKDAVTAIYYPDHPDLRHRVWPKK